MNETQIPLLFIGHQPILGREQQLLAYELLFSQGPVAANDRIKLADEADTSTVSIASLASSNALGPFRGFIPVSREFLFSELLEALPPAQVVLELLDTVEPSDDVIARCKTLGSLGYSISVGGDNPARQTSSPLVALADIIRIDIRPLEANELRAAVDRNRAIGKQLLARNVETFKQLRVCQALGFDLFQGYFFTRPEIVAGSKLNPSQLTLMRLLGLVMEDADTSEIEHAFKAEPGLTVNLLRLTNSASSGLATKITSLRHAIAILGRRQLQRWLQLLIYTRPMGQSQGVAPLLPLAATRGRLMELLAERLQPRNREFSDQAFMVGIVSLMPALLGATMPDILDQLPVVPRVRNALIDYGGQHGQLLRIVESTEQSDESKRDEARQPLSGITSDFLAASLAQAMAWANNLGHDD